jgi:spoIIIJ-associated protein
MDKKKKKEDSVKLIEETLSELLSKLGVTANINAEKIDEGDDSHYKLNIDTQETGLLIGYHGETVNSLQLILGIMLYKKLGKWTRVIIDVGDYRTKREEAIKEMVENIIKEVLATGNAIELPFLSPLERRFVHMLLSDRTDVYSQSSGEGKNRRLSIIPKLSV